MKQIEIYDTTLRDGAQTEAISFSLHDKLLLTRRLDELGFAYVEGGYPLSNEKDAAYFRRVQALDLQTAKVCAFGMTRRKGVRPAEDAGLVALLESGAPVLTVVGKSSAFQVSEVLKTSLAENLAMISESLAYLVAQGRQVIFDAEHFFDGWKFNADYALQTVRAAATAGASTVVLCDTNGGSLPEEIGEITRRVKDALGVAIGIHCHNDGELAVANSLAAVEAGATQVQGTINGLGERCGNADLISVIANIGLKKPDYRALREDRLRHLTELSRYVYELVNMNYRDNQPFVGKSAFTHKGGMHVSGIARNTASYEHIDPQAVGNERRILVSELSGRSNILAKRPEQAQATAGDGKRRRRVTEEILAAVVALEGQGYQFETADGSFDLLVRKCRGDFRPHFERLHYHVSIETNPAGETTTEATVKLCVAGELRHEVAEGDGPVNALDAAMRKALNGAFPNLNRLQLIDYKVRVINSDAGTAACVRVIIESKDDEEVWGTVGVNENIIEASWIALCDSFEYKLYKDQKRASGASSAAHAQH